MAEAPEDLVAWLHRHFRPEAADGLRASYQFELSGPGGGCFWARIEGPVLEAGAGELADPDVRIRLGADDYRGILAGRVNPELLLMQGRLEVEGDLPLASRIRAVFGAPP